MTKILMKLKETSKREFLNTQSGYTITKESFVEVDDNDKFVESFILYRNDIEIKNVGDNKFVDSSIPNNNNDTTKEVFKEKDDTIKIKKKHKKNNKKDVEK